LTGGPICTVGVPPGWAAPGAAIASGAAGGAGGAGVFIGSLCGIGIDGSAGGVCWARAAVLIVRAAIRKRLFIIVSCYWTGMVVMDER